MKKSEVIVEKLLKDMGFQSVVYEPDGNIPPDFLADCRVAIEVRRLNQTYDDGNGKRGLEEFDIPLYHKIKSLAQKIGPSDGESWFLFFRFSRPIKPLAWISHKILLDFSAFVLYNIGSEYFIS